MQSCENTASVLRIEKKTLSLSVFTDNIIYVENAKELTKTSPGTNKPEVIEYGIF